MKKKITLKWSEEKMQTKLLFGDDVLELHLPQFCKKRCDNYALITDSNLKSIHGEKLLELLNHQDVKTHLITIPAGEESKSREMKAQIEDEMFSHGLGRTSGVIAMGGGVVTDIAGFVASTYCRGIPFISVPTTLLSMVDAAVGGKTGINLPGAKNFIGSIYQPEAICIETTLLRTLSDAQMRSGVAEVIKYGLVWDKNLLDLMKKNHNKWLKRDLEFLTEIILQSILAKKAVTEKDPKEKGLRRILNYGHTVGHAFESLENYQIAHGDAVAIGLYIESELSERLGHLTQGEVAEIKEVLKLYDFPLKISSHITAENLLETMKRDKKATADEIRCVLLEKIGTPLLCDNLYCKTIDQTTLLNLLNQMLQELK